MCPVVIHIVIKFNCSRDTARLGSDLNVKRQIKYIDEKVFNGYTVFNETSRY